MITWFVATRLKGRSKGPLGGKSISNDGDGRNVFTVLVDVDQEGLIRSDAPFDVDTNVILTGNVKGEGFSALSEIDAQRLNGNVQRGIGVRIGISRLAGERRHVRSVVVFAVWLCSQCVQ